MKWGGWASIIYEDSKDHIVKPVSDHISELYTHDWTPPRYRKEDREQEWKQVAPLLGIFLNAYFIQDLDRLLDGPGCLTDLVQLTESPIEVAFLLGAIICAREHYFDVTIDGLNPATNTKVYKKFARDSHSSLLIQPQKEIGDYRVDFLLSYTAVETKYVETASPRPEDKYSKEHFDKKIIVECDGHDFHEKTKEQAARDKKRDRFLQTMGYPVHRFTGSELFRDPIGSAAELIKAISSNSLDK